MTEFSEDLTAEICERIAEGESVRAICRDPAMPAMSTVFKWLANDTAFAEQYARAKSEQADRIFEQILEIADDGRNDWMERNGEDAVGFALNGEHVQRSKLRIEARKWMAGKLRPKKYGEKIEVAGTLNVDVSTKEQRDAAVAAAMAARDYT